MKTEEQKIVEGIYWSSRFPLNRLSEQQMRRRRYALLVVIAVALLSIFLPLFLS